MSDPSRRPEQSLKSVPVLADVVDFLGAHAPFDAVDRSDLERVAASAEVEFHLAGTLIFSQGAQPVEHAVVQNDLDRAAAHNP